MISIRPVELHVLLALSAGPSHGYALVRRIDEDSEGRLSILPGNLYTVIRRLETDGLVAESKVRPRQDEDQRRRYFQITEEGRRVLEGEARHLRSLTERVHTRLEPALDDAKK